MAVRLRRRSELRTAAASAATGPHLGLYGLIALALALLVLSRAYEEEAGRLRAGVSDAVVPVLEVLSRPIESFNRAGEAVRQFWATYEENARLRREVSRLNQWQAAAHELERVNRVLTAQLNVRADGQPGYVTARVVADSGSPFVRTLLLAAGSDAGVQDMQAAISGAGLIGRVAQTGKRSARILLITDLNSRVPILLQSSGQRAILAGDNSDLPKLEFLPTGAEVQPGDRVVTSGHGAVFPPGLPIGRVTSISDDGVRVRPFVEWNRLHYVTVLQYTAPPALPAKRGKPEAGAGL